jgi:hypothetical protein
MEFQELMRLIREERPLVLEFGTAGDPAYKE